jgi:hypothetical protein
LDKEGVNLQKIPIKYADSSMILAKAVTRSDGMVLAGADLQITDNLLSRLKDAGIVSVVVKGRPMPAMDSGDIDLPKMRGRLDHLFRKHQQNTLMWNLRNMIDQYLEQIITAQEEALKLEQQESLQDEAAT